MAQAQAKPTANQETLGLQVKLWKEDLTKISDNLDVELRNGKDGFGRHGNFEFKAAIGVMIDGKGVRLSGDESKGAGDLWVQAKQLEHDIKINEGLIRIDSSRAELGTIKSAMHGDDKSFVRAAFSKGVDAVEGNGGMHTQKEEVQALKLLGDIKNAGGNANDFNRLMSGERSKGTAKDYIDILKDKKSDVQEYIAVAKFGGTAKDYRDVKRAGGDLKEFLGVLAKDGNAKDYLYAKKHGELGKYNKELDEDKKRDDKNDKLNQQSQAEEAIGRKPGFLERLLKLGENSEKLPEPSADIKKALAQIDAAFAKPGAATAQHTHNREVPSPDKSIT